MHDGERESTILLRNPRPDPPGRFVNHDILEPVLSPFAEGAGHLLAGLDLGDLEAHDCNRRLDPEEPSKPVLGLRLDDARRGNIGAGVVGRPSRMLDGASAWVL